MKPALEEQHNIIERALGERMLNHAFIFLRQWAKELGNTPFNDRIRSLEHNYAALFDYFLAGDDTDREQVHDQMTTETYRLADEMYAAVRLKRNIVPEVFGYDAQSPESYLRYFFFCQQLTEQDFDWLYQLERQPDGATTLVPILSTLAASMKDCFQEAVFSMFIDFIDSDNHVVASQALMCSIILFVQYDLRIDFFPHLQNAFVSKIGDGQEAFDILTAIIRSPRNIEQLHVHIQSPDENSENNDNYENYVKSIVTFLPDTWVFDTIVADNEQRYLDIQQLYLSIGYMDLMWDRIDEAEQILVQRLRSQQPTVYDYINYAHCCFVKGDRILAYENYRQAKSMCASNQQFLDIFRPDRKALLDNGISLDDIYLIEDQLLRPTT